MAVALAMMSGRTGAVVGNSLYPLLLEAGCAPPFFYNGLLSLSKCSEIFFQCAKFPIK